MQEDEDLITLLFLLSQQSGQYTTSYAWICYMQPYNISRRHWLSQFTNQTRLSLSVKLIYVHLRPSGLILDSLKILFIRLLDLSDCVGTCCWMTHPRRFLQYIYVDYQVTRWNIALNTNNNRLGIYMYTDGSSTDPSTDWSVRALQCTLITEVVDWTIDSFIGLLITTDGLIDWFISPGEDLETQHIFQFE